MSGFRQAIFPAGEYVSDWVADVKKGLNSLYAYCPLVEPIMVGDAQVPLLRIVPLKGRNGEMITRVFDPIQYCLLIQRRFQTVEIDIRDDTGSIVPFERGRVVVTPHCRKRKEFSLEWNQLIVTIRKLTTIIAYTKQDKDILYLREDDIKEDMDSIFGGLFKAAMPLLKKGAKTLEREALKTGSNIARNVQGRNIKQAAKSRMKSTGENLLQKAMDTVEPPGQRVLNDMSSEKRPDVGRPSNGTHRMKFRIRMAFVHPNSYECTKSELVLFEVAPTQTSVAYGYWEQKGLTSALTDQGPYEFAVSGAGDDYIDLANTYLLVEAHIMDDDDTALDGGADVGPVNLWMHSLFSNVSISLNENLVSPPTRLYPYRAYIEVLLSYGTAAK